MPGTLFVVASPIGNLEDISARALRVLREVRLIAAEDTRRTARLLARYAINTPTTSFHQHNESSKLATLLKRLQQGEDLALVSDAGTPTISDPGQHLVRAAIEAGVRVEPIPGPSAVLAALAASGIDAGTFLFLGFPPIRSKDRTKWFEDLKRAGRPVVFFEAPHRIRSTLTHLEQVVGDCHVTIARELTKTHEEFVRGPISSVLKQLVTPLGEFTVVAQIGHITDIRETRVATGEDLLNEFGHITLTGGMSRRRAVNALAKTHGLAPNVVYDLIERAKRSVE
jgi:16S rRNA (cytidine1402-2'-O)-methyltransferase